MSILLDRWIRIPDQSLKIENENEKFKKLGLDLCKTQYYGVL